MNHEPRIAPVRRQRQSLAPDAFDRMLAIGAVLLLTALLGAVVRGHAEWSHLTWAVWFHLFTIAGALTLTPILLLRRRGDRTHKKLGWAWAALMVATAVVSFNIRFNTPGQLSWIHLLSVLTLLLAPAIVLAARSRKLRLHRNLTRTTVAGALLLAGFFTFPFERLLGGWLFG